MPEQILRRWSARIRTADAAEYADYVQRTGGAEYAATPGNQGHQLLLRDNGDDTTTVTTLSWWESMDSIRGFAGDDVERANYYPEDDRYLLDRPETVEHHRVVGGRLPPD